MAVVVGREDEESTRASDKIGLLRLFLPSCDVDVVLALLVLIELLLPAVHHESACAFAI